MIKVKKNVSDKTIIIIGIITLVLGIACIGFNVHGRIKAAKNSKNYVMVTGTISRTDVKEFEDSDDHEYEKYCASIDYKAGVVIYTYTTGYDYDNEPRIGKKVKLMYKENNPSKCYLPYKDWMTNKNIPKKYNTTVIIFMGMFLISIAMIMLAVLIGGKGKATEYLLGIALLLIGVSGIFTAIMDGQFGFFFLIIFGALGVFVLYRAISGKSDIEVEERLVTVKYTDRTIEENKLIVVFEVMGDNGKWSDFYSYRTEDFNKYQIGNEFQLNTALIKDLSNVQIIGEYNTIDISYLKDEDFKNLSQASEKILDFMLKKMANRR